MTSDATSSTDRFTARWEADLVLGAYWRELRAANRAADLAGGSLSFAAQSPDGTADGMSYLFGTDASTYLFTDAYGRPSALVADTAALRQRIEDGAKDAGLTIDSVSFFSLEGTDVAVTGVVSDPAAFLDKYLRSIPPLFGDRGGLEGALLILRDRDGGVVKQSYYSTGLQSGEGGNGAGYPDGGDLDRATSPP